MEHVIKEPWTLFRFVEKLLKTYSMSTITGLSKRTFSDAPYKQIISQDVTKYADAIKALNSLQSNASVIQEARIRQSISNYSTKQVSNIETTLKYIKRLGLKLEQFEPRLIHISGTKGKGSTAIMTEALLRDVPYKTGLFLSPHITSVRERIMINGMPLSLKSFVNYFWSVYNVLSQNKDHETDMPSYFKFLTVMAIKVFISENVDVAIMEVGMGGELDCTNVFKKTPVVGITSIGLDHTKLLGDTVEKIAWQKAGIMKPSCLALTIPYQSPSVLQVFRERAEEKQCRFEVVPDTSEYNLNCTRLSYPKRLNASLAIQLAKAWSSWNSNGHYGDFNKMEISREEEIILSTCSIPGRCQVVKSNDSSISYFLDGAHTLESIQVAKQWFQEVSPKDSTRILVFNVTGGRSPHNLLKLLFGCHFSAAIFCTNCIYEKEENLPEDLINCSTCLEEAFSKAKDNMSAWGSIGGTGGYAIPSVADAIALAKQLVGDDQGSILFTGSMHLVGSALFLIKPTL